MPLFDNLKKMFSRRPEVRMPRRWQRIVMTETGVLTLPGDRREPVKLVNLSAGGARVRTTFMLPAHERVTLTLSLGTNRHNIAAHVVYCRRDPQGLHYDAGLSFVNADRDGIPEILAFIEDEKQRRFGTKDAWRG